MPDLTQRQLQILKAIIEEYISTAEPVGSETLDKKYNLGVSPATIRNEMVKLTQIGYLKQPHTSAGRSPTPEAMKLYVNQLMQTTELSVADEVTVKQKIWDYRSQMDKLLREATRALSQQTKTMTLSATDEGDIYVAGVGNILDMPEFYDIDVTRHLLDTLDQYDYWWNLISRIENDDDDLSVLLGEDLGKQFLRECGGIFFCFRTPTHHGAIGVLGPTRLDYAKIIPVVRYMGDLIGDMAKGW
jgi:heat-inducible transcriptional repressor